MASDDALCIPPRGSVTFTAGAPFLLGAPVVAFSYEGGAWDIIHNGRNEDVVESGVIGGNRSYVRRERLDAVSPEASLLESIGPR